MLTLSVFEPVKIWVNSSAQQALHEALEFTRSAEQLGYKRVWFSENHNTGDYACSAPELLIAQALGQTSRLRFGSANLLLPHQSALKVAESYRTLEGAYPQRVDLGVALHAGTDPAAAKALHRVRAPMEEEGYELHFNDVLKFLTDHYQINGKSIVASPVTSTIPELWMMEIANRGARYAAEYGTGLALEFNGSTVVTRGMIESYRKFFTSSAFFTKPRTILILSALCAETDEQAAEYAAALPEHAAKTALTGSVSNVVAAIRAIAEETTADELMLDIPHPDLGVRIQTLKMLAEAFHFAKTAGGRDNSNG